MLTVLSLGAGVQSSVMLLMASQGELPRPDHAIFADTGWEPQAIYDHLSWLRTQTDIPIHRVQAGDLRADTIAGRNHNGRHVFLDIPHFISDGASRGKLSKRQCTSNYKVAPIIRKARELAGYAPTDTIPAGTIIQQIGISTDEAHRMKEPNRAFLRNSYPLIDAVMSRDDCRQWFQRRWPHRQLAKSSCPGCPFHSNRTWLELYRRGGAEWDDTVAIDERLRAPDYPARRTDSDFYLHRDGPLAEVIPRLAAAALMNPRLPGLDRDGQGNECEGICFT